MKKLNNLKKIGMLFLFVFLVFLGYFFTYKKDFKINDNSNISSENFIEYKGDSRVIFQYDKRANLEKIDNPVYGDKVLELRLKDNDLKNSIEIEYSEGMNIIDAKKNNLTNIDVKEQKFGNNIFGVYFDKNQNKKVFQLFKDGYVVSFAIPDTETLPRLVDLSSVKIYPPYNK